MNQDRTCCTNSDRPLRFSIRRSDFGYDERAAYAESVCAVLLESRFGPGDISPWIFDWNDRPEPEPAPFFDLCDAAANGFAPPARLNVFSPLGRKGFQVIKAAQRIAKDLASATVAAYANALTSRSPSNLARGSP